jgi:predicted secreted protein
MNSDVLQHSDTKAMQTQAVPGATQTTQLTFRAVRPGESVVNLRYARPWEKEKPPLREFSVRIRVTPAKAGG